MPNYATYSALDQLEAISNDYARLDYQLLNEIITVDKYREKRKMLDDRIDKIKEEIGM